MVILNHVGLTGMRKVPVPLTIAENVKFTMIMGIARTLRIY